MVETETEMGVMQLQAKECHRMPVTARSHQKLDQAGRTLSQGLQREHGPDVGPLASRTVRQ